MIRAPAPIARHGEGAGGEQILTVPEVAPDLRAELLQRGCIKEIIKGDVTREIRLPLSRGSVRIIHGTLRAMLYAAVHDGVLVANPAEHLGRHLKLVPGAATRQKEIKAMTRAQLAAFLAAATAAEAQGEERRLYPFFLLLARAGLSVQTLGS